MSKLEEIRQVKNSLYSILFIWMIVFFPNEWRDHHSNSTANDVLLYGTGKGDPLDERRNTQRGRQTMDVFGGTEVSVSCMQRGSVVA
jgi:hypothetical protein